jgi:hypothetical protein
MNIVKNSFNKRVIIPYVDIAKLEGKVISYKSLIIEWCQKEKKISITTFLMIMEMMVNAFWR